MKLLTRSELKEVSGGKLIIDCVPVRCHCPASYNWSTIEWEGCYQEGDLTEAIEAFYDNSCDEGADPSLTTCNRI